MNTVQLKRPSAWIPVTMSLVALATVLVHLALAGPSREADEGAAAHIWQLLMLGQIPLIAYFALRWLKTDYGRGLLVLGIQAAAACAAAAPVYVLGL